MKTKKYMRPATENELNFYLRGHKCGFDHALLAVEQFGSNTEKISQYLRDMQEQVDMMNRACIFEMVKE